MSTPKDELDKLPWLERLNRVVDDEIAVLGINTARALAFKGGRVSAGQLARVREVLGRLERRTRILVSHHPCTDLRALSDCGVDVLVSGHRHATRIGYAGDQAGRALVVEASTATSWRIRAEPNGFNLLRIEPRWVEVEHYWFQAGNFMRAARAAFSREAGGWKAVRNPETAD